MHCVLFIGFMSFLVLDLWLEELNWGEKNLCLKESWIQPSGNTGLYIAGTTGKRENDDRMLGPGHAMVARLSPLFVCSSKVAVHRSNIYARLASSKAGRACRLKDDFMSLFPVLIDFYASCHPSA